MAARLAPNDVRRMHQSLHHLVADAPWNDEEMLAEVRRYVLPTMRRLGPVVAWIVDDTGFPKQGSIPWASPGSIAVSWANRITVRRR
jgi:SRSO17 transposase